MFLRLTRGNNSFSTLQSENERDDLMLKQTQDFGKQTTVYQLLFFQVSKISYWIVVEGFARFREANFEGDNVSLFLPGFIVLCL